MLPAQWHVFDEMYVSAIYVDTIAERPVCRYNFKSDPRDVGAIVILSANESSYNGAYFPICFHEAVTAEWPNLAVADPGPRTFNQGSPHPTGMKAYTLG